MPVQNDGRVRTPTTITADASPQGSTSAPPPAPVLSAPPAPSTTAGDRPVSTPPPAGALPVGIPGLAALDALAQTQAAKPSALALLPGRYPDAVSLPDLLKGAGQTAEGQALVKRILGQIEATTGRKVPPALVSAILANPGRIADAAMVTPKEISAGVDALNLAYAAGKLSPLAPMSTKLPNGFELGKLSTAPVDLPKLELKPLGGGLLQGDLPSGIGETEAKANIALAEAFQRLSRNGSLAATDKPFAVKLDGKRYTRLESVLGALAKSGHTITATVEHRVANFADFKTKLPDGAIVDVPAAVLVKTGVKDASGKEAVVPTVHTELVIHVRSDGVTKGDKVDADIKWYQGISGTGFFPANLTRTPSWCGGTTSSTFEGKQALDAVKLAGLLSDVINASADAQHLAVGGYGATGVCNDTVCVIQHALTGSCAAYPLLMRDETLQAELTKRLSDAKHADDPEYKQLAKAIAEVPSDVSPNPTSRTRALASFPYAPGKEPFQSTADARVILAGGDQ